MKKSQIYNGENGVLKQVGQVLDHWSTSLVIIIVSIRLKTFPSSPLERIGDHSGECVHLSDSFDPFSLNTIQFLFTQWTGVPWYNCFFWNLNFLQNTILIGNIRKYIEGKLCTRKYKEAKRYSRWQPVREQCNSTPQPYCLCTANTKYPLWSILILEHWTLKFN